MTHLLTRRSLLFSPNREAIIEEFKQKEGGRFSLRQESVKRFQKSGEGMHAHLGIKQGEIEFGGLKGHRAMYCICPEEMEDPAHVLMHMFNPDSPVGWKLRPPALTVYGLGGRDREYRSVEVSFVII